LKIVINENENAVETEIVVSCRKADEQILRMIAGMRAFDKKITGFFDIVVTRLRNDRISVILSLSRGTGGEANSGSRIPQARHIRRDMGAVGESSTRSAWSMGWDRIKQSPLHQCRTLDTANRRAVARLATGLR